MHSIQAVGIPAIAPHHLAVGHLPSARGTISFADALAGSMRRRGGEHAATTRATHADTAAAWAAMERTDAVLRAAMQVQNQLLTALDEIKNLRI